MPHEPSASGRSAGAFIAALRGASFAFLVACAPPPLPASEPEQLDGVTITLRPEDGQRTFAIGPRGATLTCQTPTMLHGGVLLSGASGLETTVIAHSLRDVTSNDWRHGQRLAGTRHDALIDFPTPAFGTPTERSRFHIAGNDQDWDDFSMQWDGYIRILRDGTTLALRSDDGSRMWIDVNGDGVVQGGEWTANGWGSGQGATLQTMRSGLARGTYRFRVQYEEGGGENSCQLLWNDPEAGTTDAQDAAWRVVPASALDAGGLNVSGPLTVAGPLVGAGTVHVLDGAHLAGSIAVSALEIVGRVTLDRDLDLTATSLLIPADGTLLINGHRLLLGACAGAGRIELGGGQATLPSGSSAVTIAGPGTLAATGLLHVGALEGEVSVQGGPVGAGAGFQGAASLMSPLTTLLTISEDAPGPRLLEATIEVPADAPADLGIGAWRADRQGRWFQEVLGRRLPPGIHHLAFTLDAAAPLLAEGHRGQWSADAAVTADRIGLFLFSATKTTTAIGVTARARPLPPAPAPPAAPHRLTDLVLDRSTGAATGRRWQLTLRPDPYPQDPFDQDEFALELEVIQPDGVARRFAGFHDEPTVGVDRGDLETFTTTAAPRFAVRFRPCQPGIHHLRLHARWRGQPELTCALPDLQAEGQPWDDIVRVDAGDPRFFSAGGAFVWPLGCNLNSTYDRRSQEALGTVLTPDRGSFTRLPLLERLAAGGGTGCETWLSPWNLGLEWIEQWPGFHGAGRYHLGHAAALDRYLDRAEAMGMRVNLTVFNHSMARNGTSAEDDWKFHPYNRINGGWLDAPTGLFTDPRAFAYQRRLFRYLAARYGDSPALLGWKLFAEINLVNAPDDDVVAWQGRAANAIHELDPWHHPVTSHWCGDWHQADRRVIALPGIDYACIDAYHDEETVLAQLLADSTGERRGLSRFGKPVLVTEFGGSPMATNAPRLASEHAIGPWAGMVSGHAGAPMLWWFEWLDQGSGFTGYAAVARYLAGEDLRGREAHSVALQVTGDDLWCRAWARPGRLLGYVLDPGWSQGGGTGRTCSGGAIVAGDHTAAGGMHLEFWDADTGDIVVAKDFVHAGGALSLPVPTFHRHLAFKLWRTKTGEH